MSQRKKWKKEATGPARDRLIKDLYEAKNFWHQRYVALGIHPAQPQAKALCNIEHALTVALDALGEDISKPPHVNIFADKKLH